MSSFLVVDDSRALRLAIMDILKSEGHEIVGEAGNGMEAYEQYKELKPDVVTMDIVMPEMNGIEALNMIIKEFPEAKVIMISSLYQKGMVVEALKLGAKDYVVKPINKEKVLPVVNNVLDDIESKEKNAIKENQNFDMKMLKGAYVLYFHENFNSEDFFEFSEAVKFLEEVKDVKIIFDFGTNENFNPGVFEFLINELEKILSYNKYISIFSENALMIDRLKKRGLGKLLFKLS